MLYYLKMLKKQPFACLLVLLSYLSLVSVCSGTIGGETAIVFQGNKTAVRYTDDEGKMTNSTPRLFYSPAFFGGVVNNKELFGMIASAFFYGSSNKNGFEAVASTSYGNYTQWTPAERFTNVSTTSDRYDLWGDLTAVMKGNKIFVLATTMDRVSSQNNLAFSSLVRNALMVVGTVMNCTSANGCGDGVFIKWEAPKLLNNTVLKSVNGTGGSQFIGGEGNGIVTTNGTIIFPIVMTQGEKVIASILYSIDDGKTWRTGGTTEIDTHFGSVVEWTNGKLLLTVPSGDGYRKVFESDDMGITWKRSPVFFGVWGNSPNRSLYATQGSSIAVPVDGKNVLLFSHPMNKRANKNLDTLQLWLSDGHRIVCIGTISDKEKEENTRHSILAYVGEHLYVTHDINPSGSLSENKSETKAKWEKVIGLTPLPDLFDSVKKRVRAWREMDTFLQTQEMPTNGLVGLLRMSKDKSVWEDIYSSVNATVTGGEIVDGGFRFSGKDDSGAKWPVSSQGQNQVYMFTKHHFTIAATVIIHDINGSEDAMFFGAVGDNIWKSVTIGIGYTKNKKWCAMHGKRLKNATAVSFDLEKEYNIAITFADNKASIYVNGVNITKETWTENYMGMIDHFFIGGPGNSSGEKSSVCTVKNVMLFNRKLKQEEILKVSQILKTGSIEAQIHNTHTLHLQNIHKAGLSAGGKKLSVSDGQQVTNGNVNAKLLIMFCITVLMAPLTHIFIVPTM